jgi:hypothetical protein
MAGGLVTTASDTEKPRGRDLAAPSAFYCTGEEFLRVTSFGSVTSTVLAVRSRLVDLDGRVYPSSDRHVPNSDRTSASTDHPLGAGWLLGCEVFASSSSPRVGQVFVLVEVMRGSGAGATVLQTLLQGYVSDTARLSWPGSFNRWSTEGAGVLRSVTGTDPAAGVEINETVPTNARWRIHGFTAQLVTSAVVASREMALILDDGANVFVRVPAGAGQTASLTRLYSAFYAAQRNTLLIDTTINFPLPRLDLQGGHRIRTITTAIDAGDNWGAPQMLVEEWIED